MRNLKEWELPTQRISGFLWPISTRAFLNFIDQLPDKIIDGFVLKNEDSDIKTVSENTPSTIPSEPTNKSIWLGIVAFLGAVGLFAVMVIFQDSLGNAGPLGELFFILLLGILAGVAFFEFMSSKAESNGKILGMNIKLSGPIIAGIAVALGGYLFLKNSSQGPFGFTVSLQQDKTLQIPATHPILEEAKLLLRLGDEWKPAEVDANGDAHFRNIASVYKNQLIKVRLDARYWSLKKDSIETKGKSQTLFLQPDGSLSKIIGKVKDGTTAEPLKGVTVEALGIAIQSDTLGNFKLHIPLDKQRIEYEVNAYLQGYVPFKGNATPATGATMSILMNRK